MEGHDPQPIFELNVIAVCTHSKAGSFDILFTTGTPVKIAWSRHGLVSQVGRRLYLIIMPVDSVSSAFHHLDCV